MNPITHLVRIKFLLATFVVGIFAVPALGQEAWSLTKVAAQGQDLNTVYFLDSKRGWIGGDNGFLSRTEDGGTSWVQQAVGFSDDINDIYFSDKENGFLIAGNAIFNTADSGIRWTEARRFLPREFEGAVVELYSVRFPTKKKGWVVGSISRRDIVVDSILIHTPDGGETWQRQRTPSKLELIHLDFDNDKRGWLAGAGGTILKTTDGGLTWTKQNTASTATIYHIDFRNDKRGWAVGERGLILRTTDGGEVWQTVTTETRSTLLSINFVNDDDGWAVGRAGTIIRSGDGGRTWVQQASPTKQNIYSLEFNKKIGWAVGGDGIILRYEK